MNDTSTTRTRPSGLLVRWATVAFRHKWRVFGAWAVLIALAVGLGSAFGTEYATTIVLPGTEAQRAVDVLNDRFPSAAGDSATIVFQAEAGVADPSMRPRIETFLAEVATLPNVVSVSAPYDDPGAVSEDGAMAYATVQYDEPTNDVEVESVRTLLALVDRSAGDGLQVEAGGPITNAAAEATMSSSELIGIAVAMLIMLLMFGSIIAMGLPIITAVVGLALSLVLAPVVANSFTLTGGITDAFISMIGLGVGIDYARFILNRYRDGLLDGLTVEQAAVRAINTSGRAVVFAGITVAIGLLGLSAMGLPFVTGIGVAGAIAVLVSVAVAIFLMPAVLALVGRSVLRWRIPGLGRRTEGQNAFWWRWGRTVQRRPAPVAAVLVVLLAVVSIPYFDMQLGLSDDGNAATDQPVRRAYDLLSEGFGPGFNGPLLLVLEQDRPISTGALDTLTTALQATDGVDGLSPVTLNEAGDTAVVQVFPTTGPQDEATGRLIARLRDDVLPQTLGDSGGTAMIGGLTAVGIDLSDRISSRLPIFFAVVIGLTILLLTVVFRSVVIPVKAALMNLLSVGVAYGAVVAVFQWGWGKDLLGVAREGPVEAWLPMLLFGIIFGLSMDYELFLVSRVQEERRRQGDSRLVMLTGVGLTGKVVAAAGAIMAAVFFAFVLGDDRAIKELGFGLGVAILVDAFLIRLILVPAVMTMLGDRAWYIPAWLDAILPRLNVDVPDDQPSPRGRTDPGLGAVPASPSVAD